MQAGAKEKRLQKMARLTSAQIGRDRGNHQQHFEAFSKNDRSGLQKQRHAVSANSVIGLRLRIDLRSLSCRGAKANRPLFG